MMPEKDNLPITTVAAKRLSPRSVWPALCLFMVLAVLLLVGWQWLDIRQQLADMKLQLSDSDVGIKEEHGAQKALREQIEGLQAKLGAVEGKLNEYQGQNAALESLYQDVATSREAATLLEVEQAITLGRQQLQLAGNVPIAILALQTADARLAHLDRPRYLPLRKAVSKDLERLNALPFADIPGISLRLEQVVVAVDKLPLAAYGRPAETREKSDVDAMLPWWRRTGQEVWQEIKSLIRIQRLDQADAVLLAPGQDFFLRENLKLRLLNGRLALLARDQQTYRNEIKVAHAWLARHFLKDDKGVQSTLLELQKMLAAPVSIDLPDLNDSQAALRSLRNSKEKR
jgi:uroporphyrin-III C-methyltransferase